MKTSKLIIAIIALAIVATTVAVVSCKKEKQEQTLNKVEQSAQHADNMDEYLISFKNKLLSAQKGEETISLEQAQRDLGNLLNFDFGDANYPTTVFHHDTLFTNITLTNDGQVDLSQLAATYLNLRNQVQNAFNQVNLPEKTVYSISCIFDNNSKNNETQVTLVLTTRAFEETTTNSDDWRAGNRAGKCDGTLVGFWGAPEQIVSMLCSNLGNWSCINGRVYFTEEGQCYIESNEPEMSDPNSPSYHRLFYIHDPTGQLNLKNTCLSSTELLYYYNQAASLHTTCGQYFHPTPFPSNHVVRDYYIEYQESSFGSHKTAWWKIYLWHAKLNCTETPILD